MKNHSGFGSTLRRRALLPLALVGPLANGCLCEEERPYTPFAVATSLPQEEKRPELVGATPTPAAPTATSGVLAPANKNSWKVFERELKAPRDTVFAAAAQLARPDGSARIVAWVSAAKSGGEAGLWEFGDDGRAKTKLVGPPAFLPSGSDCTEKATVESSGKRTFVVDLKRTCTSRQLPGSPERALLVVDPEASPVVGLSLRIAALSPGEALGLRVDAADQDGDGSDDVLLQVELATGESPAETLPFSWLRRPAGLSRQKDSPARELTTRAGELVVSGQRKADRGLVPARIDTLRRLYGAFCAESQAVKVTLADGTLLPCNISGTVWGRLVVANVHAQLGLGRVSRALGEFERADWYGGEPAEKEQAAAEKLLLAKLKNGASEQAAEMPRTLPALASQPGLAPLRFVDKVLWLDDGQVVTRLWPEAPPVPEGEEPPPSPAPRPRQPAGPGGKRVVAVLPSCDRAEVLVAYSDDAGTAFPASPLPLLAPRPGQCKRLGGAPLPASLLGWTNGEAELVVGSEYFSGSKTVPPERPVAIPTSLGLAVQSKDGVELWTDSRLHGGLDCVASSDGALAACASGTTVSVWKRPASFVEAK